MHPALSTACPRRKSCLDAPKPPARLGAEQRGRAPFSEDWGIVNNRALIVRAAELSTAQPLPVPRWDVSGQNLLAVIKAAWDRLWHEHKAKSGF